MGCSSIRPVLNDGTGDPLCTKMGVFVEISCSIGHEPAGYIAQVNVSGRSWIGPALIVCVYSPRIVLSNLPSTSVSN